MVMSDSNHNVELKVEIVKRKHNMEDFVYIYGYVFQKLFRSLNDPAMEMESKGGKIQILKKTWTE